MSCPFGGEGLGELNHGGLAGVVARLLLWVVDNCAGHGGDVDDAAAVAKSHHLLCHSLCDDECPGDVDVQQTAELVVVVGLGFDVGTVCTLVLDYTPKGLEVLTRRYLRR